MLMFAINNLIGLKLFAGRAKKGDLMLFSLRDDDKSWVRLMSKSLMNVRVNRTLKKEEECRILSKVSTNFPLFVQ